MTRLRPFTAFALAAAFALLPAMFLAPKTVEAASTPPACRYDDQPASHTGYGDWAITVLDTIYQLPKGYAPPDLVPASQAGISGGGSVRSLVIPDLKALTRAAAKAGAPVALTSAYRSYNQQVSTFDGWVASSGYDAALKASARPGHSEHQLGTALDFMSKGGSDPWNYDDWATTKAGAWMKANAWRYGFALSYPKGQTVKSCYSYEPWHWRYVGRETAAAIHGSGIVPRYWLWAHGGAPDAVATPVVTPKPDPTATTVPSEVPAATASGSPSPTPVPAPLSPKRPAEPNLGMVGALAVLSAGLALAVVYWRTRRARG